MKKFALTLAAASAIALSLGAPAQADTTGVQADASVVQTGGFKKPFSFHYDRNYGYKYSYRPRHVCHHARRWRYIAGKWRYVYIGWKCEYTNNY